MDLDSLTTTCVQGPIAPCSGRGCGYRLIPERQDDGASKLPRARDRMWQNRKSLQAWLRVLGDPSNVSSHLGNQSTLDSPPPCPPHSPLCPPCPPPPPPCPPSPSSWPSRGQYNCRESRKSLFLNCPGCPSPTATPTCPGLVCSTVLKAQCDIPDLHRDSPTCKP